MKNSIFGILMSFACAGQSLAEIKFEGPSELGHIDDSCVKSAYELIDRYVDLFSLQTDVVKVRFNSFQNITRGTHSQQYFANITLFDSRGAEWGIDKTTLEVTFQAGDICDGLQLLTVENKGVDTNNPLSACLNDQAIFGSLYAARSEAFDQLMNLHAPCESLEPGTERVKCGAALNETSEGQKIISMMDAANDKISEAQQVCRDKYMSL